jgi:hypothetical protein
MLPAHLRALLLLLLAAAGALAGPTTAAANPIVEGDRPDPTVLEWEGRYYAASTSGGWAPLFPILRSDDLRTWEEIGAVLERPPGWGAGRFWAPELVRGPGGGVLAYWSSSTRGGRPCIGVASAPRPEGPWRHRGRAVCPAGGAIDAAPVVDERGRRWLAWKALGVGGGIHLQPLRRDGLRVVDPARGEPLIRPDQPWELGVTEGPAFVRRDGWWYLLYAGGTCCRPPCTYAQGVARSRTLTGPYEKRPEPVMTGNAAFRCPGHGTPLTLGAGAGDAAGRTLLLHHAYREADVTGHRRLLVLSELSFGHADGWPVLAGPDPTAPATLGPPPGPRRGAGRSPSGAARSRRAGSGRGTGRRSAPSAGAPWSLGAASPPRGPRTSPARRPWTASRPPRGCGRRAAPRRSWRCTTTRERCAGSPAARTGRATPSPSTAAAASSAGPRSRPSRRTSSCPRPPAGSSGCRREGSRSAPVPRDGQPGDAGGGRLLRRRKHAGHVRPPAPGPGGLSPAPRGAEPGVTGG